MSSEGILALKPKVVVVDCLSGRNAFGDSDTPKELLGRSEG